jgi:hypothetical protein
LISESAEPKLLPLATKLTNSLRASLVSKSMTLLNSLRALLVSDSTEPKTELPQAAQSQMATLPRLLVLTLTMD